MSTNLKKQICTLAFLIIGCTFVLAGCGAAKLPTYNLSEPGNPSQALAEFIDAVIKGDNASVNDMLYNYTWQYEYQLVSSSDGTYSFNGQIVSETDAMIIDCIAQSRSCEPVDKESYLKDSHHAVAVVNYTSFNLSKFRETLSRQVLSEISGRQYEGEVFKDYSDIAEIIEDGKKELLKNPRDFYTTNKYSVEMVSCKGKWRVIMSDEFYNALSGYAL